MRTREGELRGKVPGGDHGAGWRPPEVGVEGGHPESRRWRPQPWARRGGAQGEASRERAASAAEAAAARKRAGIRARLPARGRVQAWALLLLWRQAPRRCPLAEADEPGSSCGQTSAARAAHPVAEGPQAARDAKGRSSQSRPPSREHLDGKESRASQSLASHHRGPEPQLGSRNPIFEKG